MVPAISFALGRLNALNTRKVVGATTALKKMATPNHDASSNSLMLLRMANDRVPNRTQLFPAATISWEAGGLAASILSDPQHSITMKARHRVAPDSFPDRET